MNTTLSKDGTVIAYNVKGAGPAVILVDGAFCSKDFGPMPKIVPLLSKAFTVYSYDRRARGESGDTKPYNVQKEIEDIEALIKLSGRAVHLFGISSGAILAMKAVGAGLKVNKLALFEPPFIVGNPARRPPDNAQSQLTQLIGEGRNGDAVQYYLRKVMRVPAIVPFILKLTPNWSKMKANAPSLPYDAAICGDFELPDAELEAVTIPTIVIDSEKSPASLREPVAAVADKLPNGRQITLKGKIHDVPPKILVPVLVEFFNN